MKERLAGTSPNAAVYIKCGWVCLACLYTGLLAHTNLPLQTHQIRIAYPQSFEGRILFVVHRHLYRSRSLLATNYLPITR
jgi:hypothetical protein